MLQDPLEFVVIKLGRTSTSLEEELEEDLDFDLNTLGFFLLLALQNFELFRILLLASLSALALLAYATMATHAIASVTANFIICKNGNEEEV